MASLSPVLCLCTAICSCAGTHAAGGAGRGKIRLGLLLLEKGIELHFVGEILLT